MIIIYALIMLLTCVIVALSLYLVSHAAIHVTAGVESKSRRPRMHRAILQVEHLDKKIQSFDRKIQPFDIVVLVGPADIAVIGRQLEHTKQNVLGYRRIFLVSYTSDLQVEGCTTIDESIFPFSKSVMPECIPHARQGWYLQQLLKLYSGLIIPDILPTYLVIDADTCVLKPTRFLDEHNRHLFSTSTERHVPYMTHMSKMHPSLIRVNECQSGICHHMVFCLPFIQDMFSLVASIHDNQPFWQTFLECVDPSQAGLSGASEYEMYFAFVQHYHGDAIRIRQLVLSNDGTCDDTTDLMSNHWYSRSE